MPNHVTNILVINGETSKVAEVIEVLNNGEGGVTFDNFAPMPEALRGTTSPTRIVSQEEYDEEKAKLDEKLASGENVWSTSLPLTAEMQKELIKEYGVDNWYDWASQNWGTKWGAYDGDIIDDCKVTFDTAWATPVNAMITLSKKFPEVEIVVDYADEDFGYNVGQYTVEDGAITNEDCPEGGSLEAYRKALDIKGGEDYYLGDMLCDIAEEEMEDKYYQNFITLVIEREDVDENFPDFLNKYILDKAVANEQFEYASKVRDVLEGKKV